MDRAVAVPPAVGLTKLPNARAYSLAGSSVGKTGWPGPRYEMAWRLPVPAIFTPAFNVLSGVMPSHLLAMY